MLSSPQAGSIQTAPIARVLPQTNPVGGLARVPIRLWDAEGNASLALLQFQPEGSTNWTDAAIAYVDALPYGFSIRVAALPTGSDHVLWWNAPAVFPPSTITNVLLRVRAMDVSLLGDWSEPMPYQLTLTLDSDGDGLPDAWEMAAFGNLSHPGSEDTDGDGFSNLSEYLAGTNPNDLNSSLKLSIDRLPGAVKLSWQGGSNAPQVLQRSFAVPFGWQDVFTNPASTPGLFTNAISSTNSFFQLRLQP